ncbi:MAG: nucleotidyltransferase family protein [Chloroflexi bacterium]|nr:nucleotidyltransferase family protein [Chloroflexota bacterium]
MSEPTGARALTGGCWPTLSQELLLRAALLETEQARCAWEEWKSLVDLDDVDWGSHRLLPLLYRNLQRQGIEDAAMGRFKGIHHKAWYRNRLLIDVLAGILEAFHRAGIETMALKGAALILLHYKDHGLRPMNDLDVLVPAAQVSQAADLLSGLGWSPKFRAPHAWVFTDSSRHEFDLHWHVLAECCKAGDDDDFWAAAVPLTVGRVETRALNPTDQLLHVCAHGLKWNVLPPVRWVADATIVLNTSEIDWNRLIAQARKRELLLTMRQALGYLRRTLGARIPEEIIEEMQDAPIASAERWDYVAKTSPPDERDPLLTFWAYYREYVRSVEGERLAARLVRWPAFLRSLWGLKHAWQVPPYAISGAAKRTWRRVRRAT